jgi:hypothetical protein
MSEPPEMEVMLSGCANDAERKAVREAFHVFAQGDPGAFSVTFAVLLQAHASALKSCSVRISEERKLVEAAAQSIASISEKRIAVGLGLAFLCGMGFYPIVTSIWH